MLKLNSELRAASAAGGGSQPGTGNPVPYRCHRRGQRRKLRG